MTVVLGAAATITQDRPASGRRPALVTVADVTETFTETCSAQVAPLTWFNVTFKVHVSWSNSFGQIDSVSDANAYLSPVSFAESLSNFSFSSDIAGDGQSVSIRGDAVLSFSVAGQQVTSVPVAYGGNLPITSVPPNADGS